MGKQSEWDYSFNNIGIRCTDKLVQVINDEHLVDFLNQDGVGSMELAEVMRNMYQEQIGRELQISQKSLAIELLGHVFFGEFVQKLENLPFSGKKDSRYQQFLESLRVRMDVIYCGERSIDSNRFIWDDLVPFAKIIFGISGKRA